MSCRPMSSCQVKPSFWMPASRIGLAQLIVAQAAVWVRLVHIASGDIVIFFRLPR